MQCRSMNIFVAVVFTSAIFATFCGCSVFVDLDDPLVITDAGDVGDTDNTEVDTTDTSNVEDADNTDLGTEVGDDADVDADVDIPDAEVDDVDYDVTDADDVMDETPDVDPDVLDPCLETATPQWVASHLGEECNVLFGAGACSENAGFTRSGILNELILGYVDPFQLQGYVPFDVVYMDVPVDHMSYDAIQKFYWLGLLQEATRFFPDDLAGICWAQVLLDGLIALPSRYMVADNAASSGLVSAGLFWVFSIEYKIYGTTQINPLENVRVVDLLYDTDDVLEEVRLRCDDSDGIGVTSTISSVSGGVAIFDAPSGCYDYNQDGLLEVQVQLKFATTATSGQAVQVEIEGTTLQIRGERLEPPVYTIE